jgi:two-component system, cell cycle response regulator
MPSDAPRRRTLRSPLVFGLLAILSLWFVAYELADTVLGSWSGAVAFASWHPDVPFVIAGLLLIARGLGPDGERGWALIGVGAICWASGDVYWSVQLSTLPSPPVPSWADAGYLSFCPLVFLGILSLVRQRVQRAPKTLIADAAAAALAVGAVSGAVVVRPVLAHASGGALAVATNLAYPLFDLLLLGLIIGLLALRNWRIGREWLLVGSGVLAFWIADSAYLVTVADNTYQNAAWFNPLWYVAPTLMALAAWLPYSGRSSVVIEVGEARGIVLPLTFACLALGLLVWSSFSSIGVVAVVLCALSLLVVMARLVLTWREHSALLRATRTEALTDSLTGMSNRRALTLELNRRTVQPEPRSRYALALFDLDGFKHYNDSFGHPAGDVLLRRLGDRLTSRLGERGLAYRMGGDEFCVLIDDDDRSQIAVSEAAAALTEQGEGFAIGCSYGLVLLPDEADEVSSALRLADQRMYAHKQAGRSSASRQSGDVLLRVLAERDPSLGHHMQEVAVLAAATARRLSISGGELEQIRQAAELHDVGKVAIPDTILTKPAALSQDEWQFIRRHTLIGERILAAAPALRGLAGLVRSSHENFDGSGYPDGLAGAEIPVGSRIIAVCDAFHAMTTDRPYRAAMSVQEALAELRRCAGGQFDPTVVDMFCDALIEQGSPAPGVESAATNTSSAS